MVFLFVLALLFGTLVATRAAIKFRQANDVIEGAFYEVDRARQERTAAGSGELAGYYDGNSRWGFVGDGVPRG